MPKKPLKRFFIERRYVGVDRQPYLHRDWRRVENASGLTAYKTLEQAQEAMRRLNTQDRYEWLSGWEYELRIVAKDTT